MTNSLAIAAEQTPSPIVFACPGGFSVADLCRRWKIGADKVHGFIRRGELVALNVATNLSARPQWRVTPEAVAAFERRRSTGASAKPGRRNRRRPHEVDYYPD